LLGRPRPDVREERMLPRSKVQGAGEKGLAPRQRDEGPQTSIEASARSLGSGSGSLRRVVLQQGELMRKNPRAELAVCRCLGHVRRVGAMNEPPLRRA